MQIGVILHCYMEVPRLFQDADVYTAVKTLSGEVDQKMRLFVFPDSTHVLLKRVEAIQVAKAR